MTLDDAAEVLLRGLVTAAILRAAIARYELTFERIGRRITVTRADVRAWRKRCRVSAEDRTSNSSSAPMARRPGTSGMGDSESQEAATSAMLRELARCSKSTGRGRVGRTVATARSTAV